MAGPGRPGPAPAQRRTRPPNPPVPALSRECRARRRSPDAAGARLEGSGHAAGTASRAGPGQAARNQLGRGRGSPRAPQFPRAARLRAPPSLPSARPPRPSSAAPGQRWAAEQGELRPPALGREMRKGGVGGDGEGRCVASLRFPWGAVGSGAGPGLPWRRGRGLAGPGGRTRRSGSARVGRGLLPSRAAGTGWARRRRRRRPFSRGGPRAVGGRSPAEPRLSRSARARPRPRGADLAQAAPRGPWPGTVPGSSPCHLTWRSGPGLDACGGPYCPLPPRRPCGTLPQAPCPEPRCCCLYCTAFSAPRLPGLAPSWRCLSLSSLLEPLMPFCPIKT